MERVRLESATVTWMMNRANGGCSEGSGKRRMHPTPRSSTDKCLTDYGESTHKCRTCCCNCNAAAHLILDLVNKQYTCIHTCVPVPYADSESVGFFVEAEAPRRLHSPLRRSSYCFHLRAPHFRLF